MDAVVSCDAREDVLLDGKRFVARDREYERGRGLEREGDEVGLVLPEGEDGGDDRGPWQDCHEQAERAPCCGGIMLGWPMSGWGGCVVAKDGDRRNGWCCGDSGVTAIAEFSGGCPRTYLCSDFGGKAGVGVEGGLGVGHCGMAGLRGKSFGEKCPIWNLWSRCGSRVLMG